MILADCLVFPSPSFRVSTKIEKKLVFIPKNSQNKHFYKSANNNDELSQCISTSRTRQSYRGLKTNRVKLATSFLNDFDQQQELNYKNMSRMQPISEQDCIPCLFLCGKICPEKLIIYYHSNAEDLISAYDFVRSICNHTGQSVLLVEYPGYSFYKLKQTSTKVESTSCVWGNQGQKAIQKAQIIQNDAIKIMQYVRKIGYAVKDITVIGRSIGSGPAVYISLVYSIRALVLLSPFTSLTTAVKDLYGTLCASLLKQRFNNIERSKYILCPTLLIHGKQDTMISHIHSIQLSQQIRTYCSLKIIEDMTHSSFRLYQDFIKNLNNFYATIDTS